MVPRSAAVLDWKSRMLEQPQIVKIRNAIGSFSTENLLNVFEAIVPVLEMATNSGCDVIITAVSDEIDSRYFKLRSDVQRALSKLNDFNAQIMAIDHAEHFLPGNFIAKIRKPLTLSE